MDTISGERMIRKLAQLGAIGSLPRNNLDHNLKICKRLSKDQIPCLYTTGLKDALKNAKAYQKNGAKMILVDVAYGGMTQVKQATRAINRQTKLFAFAGNIATHNQAQSFKKYDIKIARVGIGPGGLCTTRIKTGVGIPQLSAVFETKIPGLEICADGGITKPADVAKAIAAGANTVMIGSLFAGTDETPGEPQGGFKPARGQASQSYMQDNDIPLNGHRTAEGISTVVRIKGSVEYLINDIVGGLKSAMSYTGAKNIKEFQKKAIFSIANSQAAQREARPHILETS